jgi:hypothetical protein
MSWFLSVAWIATGLFLWAFGSTLLEVDTGAANLPEGMLAAFAESQADPAGLYTRTALSGVAAAIVAALFFHRFRFWADVSDAPADPPRNTTRLFTTFMHYHMWAAAYAALAAVAYLLIVYFPEFSCTILSTLQPGFASSLDFCAAETGLMDAVGERSLTLQHLGLLVSVFAFIFAFLYTPVEAKIRRYFQINALIPKQAQRMETRILRDVSAVPIDARVAQAFLDYAAAHRDIHAIAPEDLDSGVVDQEFLEPYARAEFLIWRLRDGDFSRAIEDARDDHIAIIDEIESTDMRRVRAEIAGFRSMIAQALRNLPDDDPDAALEGYPPPGRRLPSAAIEVLVSAGLTDLAKTPREELDVPASKFDDVIEGLRRNLHVLGPGLQEFNALALESLERRLRQTREAVGRILERLIRLAVCVALYADTAPRYDFLLDLGLKAETRRVRFDTGRAFNIALLVGGLFALCLAGLLVAEAFGKLEFRVDYVYWFIFGAAFIFISIAAGAYHGSACASRRIATTRDDRRLTARISPATHVYAFAMAASTLVVALFALVMFFGRSAALFDGILPFVAVPAIWGAMVAQTITRSLLDDPAENWPVELGVSLGVVGVALALIWASKGRPSVAPGEFWSILPPLVLVLTLGVFVALRYVLKRSQTEEGALSGAGQLGPAE